MAFRFRDFRFHAAGFMEQAKSVLGQQRLSQAQQDWQRRQRPADHQRRGRELCLLDFHRVNMRFGAGDQHGLSQERGLALILLDQIDFDSKRDGKDKSGETGAGTEIDGTWRQRSGDRTQLQTVIDVATPKMRQIGATDQVDGGIPLSQQRDVGFQRRLANVDHTAMIARSNTIRNRMTIVFIGDIHQHWHYIDAGLAALPTPPRAAILLGDIQCDRPLDQLAAPLLSRGIAVHWIHGNHDNDGGPEMWANLTSPERNPLTTTGSLHARIVDIDGIRIAGLGGTFRPRVWAPPSPPKMRYRHELAHDLAVLGPGHGPKQIAALAHSLSTAAIWPEDIETLAEQKADILVTHEAPSSHPSGSVVLDELARAMGVRTIVHGHHHVVSIAKAPDGLTVLAVASAWGVSIDGSVQWEGEKPRPLPSPVAGWSVQSIAA
jgi:predicted phosphodiesterase